MSKRNRIEYIPLEDNSRANFLKVEIYYRLGGVNMFSHQKEERGICLSVSPVQKSDRTEIYTAYSGFKKLLLPMARFNKTVFTRFKPDEKVVKDIIDHVLNYNNLKIKKDEQRSESATIETS